MSKYSPGPWIATGWKGIVVNDAEGNTLVLAPSGHKSLAECQATARLIAAAPELIESCERMVANDRVGPCCCKSVVAVCGPGVLCDSCFVKQAIKKAGGR